MRNETTQQGPSDSGIIELLAALCQRQPDAAWKSFLNHFAPQIMHIVRQREYNPQQFEDCFLFVCECLSDDGFRRLQQFDPGRGVSFRSWLNAVAANLCVEWHRREFGRARIPPPITRLSALDQAVFKYRYQQDLDLQTCLHMLQETDPQLTRRTLAESLARVQSALSVRQRWTLARLQGRSPSPGKEPPATKEQPDPHPGPEQLMGQEQRQSRLRRAMSQLQAEERLLLRLRFEQDLSFADVARIAGLTNLHLARRRIDAALKQLEALLGEEIAP